MERNGTKISVFLKSLLAKVNQVKLETLPQGQIVAGACKKHSDVSIVPFLSRCIAAEAARRSMPSAEKKTSIVNLRSFFSSFFLSSNVECNTNINRFAIEEERQRI